MKKLRISKVWVIVGVLVALAVITYLATRSKDESQISFSTAKVEPANIQNSVTATGTIEPVTSVTVGTQVSGIVSHLYVDYNSQVKKGQVIAELDKTNLISTLSSAKASLKSAEANVAKAKADYQSQVANLNYQRSNFNRYATLYRKGLTSANDYDNARLALQQAEEQVASARQMVAQAEQQVTQSRAQVSQAQTNLGYATITSPIDGVVLSKSVEEGQTVAASFGAPRGHNIQQRRYLSGCYQRTQQRLEAKTRTYGQRNHLYCRTQRRAERSVKGFTLHTYARNAWQEI